MDSQRRVNPPNRLSEPATSSSTSAGGARLAIGVYWPAQAATGPSAACSAAVSRARIFSRESRAQAAASAMPACTPRRCAAGLQATTTAFASADEAMTSGPGSDAPRVRTSSAREGKCNASHSMIESAAKSRSNRLLDATPTTPAALQPPLLRQEGHGNARRPASAGQPAVQIERDRGRNVGTAALEDAHQRPALRLAHVQPQRSRGGGSGASGTEQQRHGVVVFDGKLQAPERTLGRALEPGQYRAAAVRA